MKLDSLQIDSLQRVWHNYVAKGEKFVNASKEYTHQELDQRRREMIPEVLGWLNRFLKDEVQLEEFKTVNDGINKRNRLWGFQAINGQMFFNVLTKNSIAGNRLNELVHILKRALPVPSSIDNAKIIMDEFSNFVRELGKYSLDSRGAPRVGSIPFFLSYFWQIQSPDQYPIYYSSMIYALRDVSIWSPSGNVAEDYYTFFLLNQDFCTALSEKIGRKLHLWDIEHAFWFHVQSQAEKQERKIEKENKTGRGQLEKVLAKELLESYIPPIVSILPRLAANDEILSEAYRKNGKTIERVFEERIAILFGMLGFETELMGQGRGRVPDGVAVSGEYHYAIIYDAKVRQQSYTMGTDERAIKEYIMSQGERLRKWGIKSLYFMVISSVFSGNHDDAIRGMKIENNVNEVLLVEVRALLAMLEGMLRNPSISLGPDGIQRLLAFSGILTESYVREFLDI
jgi:hypothetical protein